MPYTLASATYPTKTAVQQRCQSILAGIDPGGQVAAQDAEFLLDLFSHHTEWAAKSGPGVATITVQDTGHGTRCFWLSRADGSQVDISFTHAIRHLSGGRQRDLLPQALLDFKNGARRAIKPQIDAFRQAADQDAEDLGLEVDHAYPRTFDALLFGFCLEYQVNPLAVEVAEHEGCIPHIVDDAVRAHWQGYHQQHARLQLVSKLDNLTAAKSRRDWHRVWQCAPGCPSLTDPDAYTRTCPVCGNAFQVDEFDDPKTGEGFWQQWEGPCCLGQSRDAPA